MIRLLVFSVCAIMLSSNANVSVFDKSESDLWAGVGMPLWCPESENSRIGLSAEINYQVYLPNSPIRCGVFFNLDEARRKVDGDKLTYNTYSLGGVGTWDFIRRRDYRFYAALGVGAGYNQCDLHDAPDIRRWRPAFIPRIGYRLLDIINVSAYVQVTSKQFNSCGIALGTNFSFGK